MKQVLSGLLSLAMLLSLLAGCGKNDGASPPAQQLPKGQSQAPVSDPDPAPPPVDTVILKEADDQMINTYTLLAVNPDAPFTDAGGSPVSGVAVNAAGAEALIDWFLSEEGMTLAASYGQDAYGDCLFYPLDGAPAYSGEIAPADEPSRTIRLSTTTSVTDSSPLPSV